MGKRRATLIIILLIAIVTAPSLYSSLSVANDTSYLSDLRFLAMGTAGRALATNHGSFLSNPALFNLREEPLFRIGTRFSETLFTQPHKEDPIGWIQRPTTSIEMLFSSQYLSLSIGLGSFLTDREVENSSLLFNAFSESRIQLTASYGFKGLSFGLYAIGGNRLSKEVVLRKGNTLFDYITKTYLERYNKGGGGSQFFKSGFGLLIYHSWFSLALMSDSLFSYHYDTNEMVLDFSDLLKDSSIGLALVSEEFNRQNELNKIQVSFAFDITNLADLEQRALRFGLEGKLQLLSTFWIALRAGYFERRLSPKPLFSLDGNGTTTLGLGLRIDNMLLDLAANIDFPTENFGLSIGLTWGV